MNIYIDIPQIMPSYYISKFLTTQVAYRPTALGEYRTMRKNINSVVTFDDDPPNIPPDSASGMLIFPLGWSQGGSIETGGNPGDPNRWEIFVGFDKRLQFECYESEHRTGIMNFDPFFGFVQFTFQFIGIMTTYNSKEGVAIIDTVQQENLSDVRLAGVSFPPDGAAPVLLQECYFDVLVY